VIHIRNRKGKANTQRGNPRFVDELLARVRRAGATGTILIRADTGFENHKLFKTFDARGVEFSIGVKQRKPIRALIDLIDQDAWVTLTDYPQTGGNRSRGLILDQTRSGAGTGCPCWCAAIASAR